MLCLMNKNCIKNNNVFSTKFIDKRRVECYNKGREERSCVTDGKSGGTHVEPGTLYADRLGSFARNKTVLLLSAKPDTARKRGINNGKFGKSMGRL